MVYTILHGRTSRSCRTMRPIRIAYVIDSIETPAAGTERQLLALLYKLDRNAFEPHLVCLHDSEWLRSQQFDFRVTRYNIQSLARLGTLRALLRFRSLCRREQFDIVQTFFIDGNIFGTIGATVAHYPILVSSRRNARHWHGAMQVTLLRVFRPFTEYYLANSQTAADTTRSIENARADQVVVIRNGLDFDRLTLALPEKRELQREAWGVGAEDLLVGSVANLRDVKNLPELIEAAAHLSTTHTHLRFVIVGEGPDRHALEAQIIARGLADRIQLAGRMLDISPALAAFDVAVQCSKAESSSNSLVEYMAAGLAIVASDVPGNAEILTDGESGLLYAVGNSLALARALARLAGDAPLRARLGATARAAALETHSMARCIHSHEEFYRRIVKQRGQR